jgi:hypothetical protein
MYSVDCTNRYTVIKYEYQRRISDMFRYTCTFFREHNTPGLKLIASDKLLFLRFHCSLFWAPLLKPIVYKYYKLSSFRNYG